MEHQVLAIGYCLDEYEATRQKWKRYNANLEFADSVQQAHFLLNNKKFSWVIFHSRMLESLPYIDVIRNTKFVPILIITPECTSIEQAQLAVQYLIAEENQTLGLKADHAFTYGDLFFCQNQRIVRIRGQEISLTAKEFDILALLVVNPNRVFTYEMIIDLVWKEDCAYCSRKTVINHVNN